MEKNIDIKTVLANLPIYQLTNRDKQKICAEHLLALTQEHRDNCLLYECLINAYFPNQQITDINSIPPFAVRHFKDHLLSSVSDENVFRILQSSGTSGQTSKIVLDADTAKLQSLILVKTLQHWLGKSRRPMLIIDTPTTLTQQGNMSARAAGIRGFSLFGRDHCYALSEDLSLNTQAVADFFSKYHQQPVLIFGFTYIVWQYFIEALKQKNITAKFSQASLFHGGGWKKLQAQAVSNSAFKEQIIQQLGKVNIHEYYGMVEQTGTIHIECEHGYLHTPIWADIITRRADDLSIAEYGEQGIIQVNSIIAHSYPGHALLTEDLGIIIGEDNCQCGRKGKYFQVHGRVPKAQIRGCSDTFS
jgi:phenylacetate-coenzyme A ligase PaaK-like adenylate-forming protein